MDSSSKYIYLDNAASASDSDFHILDNFANPNSTHDAGRDSFAVMEDARENLAQKVGAKRPSEIIFTSGATEANNMAIFGIARAAVKSKDFIRRYKFAKAGGGDISGCYEEINICHEEASELSGQRKMDFEESSFIKTGGGEASELHNKPKVLVSAVEHESALMPALELENEGFIVEKIPVKKFGLIDIDEYKRMLTKNVVLVIVQHANTETGVVQNIYQLANNAHKIGAYFFSDMVGTFGRFPLNVKCVDAASFSGHKIGAPKGTGFLYLKNKTPFKPLMYGSGQERGFRPGTQSVALIKSMSDAADFCYMQMSNANMQQLKEYLYKKILEIDGVSITAPEAELPNIIHLNFQKFYSEDLVLHYGKYNIIVSGGPACSSLEKELSHVLNAMKLSDEQMDGSLRLSLNYKTTKADIDKFLDATKNLLQSKEAEIWNKN